MEHCFLLPPGMTRVAGDRWGTQRGLRFAARSAPRIGRDGCSGVWQTASRHTYGAGFKPHSEQVIL